MGKLHNRRRTRLRPNKKARHQSIDITSPSSSPGTIQATINDDMSFCSERSSLHHAIQDSTSYHLNDQYEVRHMQYYGDGEGDESGDLCPLMLQVVLDLFDGVDYEDP
ncbi:hypothetical protein M436DRAFT_79334 [Aureobasidium namibiae CBS 147.97]|uniref:Uncharacterized protein n=1 Tax=Aureobasidium namibiae CBS 147.97 TaxID=1043004 RepID=A0A074X220_9PEZI